ncbi:sensor histidine kinase [Devosia submarina]|uniref:sensor histidine kinase n=1 Tax=Devosia submarina TaxID=1173082 RepID=UPI001473C0BD|nr:ATP-binding protein [Devosia submarina]
MNTRPWLSRPFLAAALTLTVLFALLLAAVTRLALNESRLSGGLSEGVIWFSSQGQYEAMRLAGTALLYESNRVPLDELVLRLDLLDSRVDLFEQGQVFRRAEAMGFEDEVATLRPMLDKQRAALETLTPDNTAGITELHATAEAIAQTMRDLANAGMLDGRNRQENVIAQRKQILLEVLGYLVATLVAGVLVAIIVVRGQRSVAHAEAALEHEREVSRLHRAFTSVVSHQFRTPLSIIDASSQRMIRRGVAMSAEEITNRATKIRNACQRLTRLMESTLNAARLEDGEIGYNPRPYDVHQLIASVCENQPEEDQGRIELQLDGLPALVSVDNILLEQALQNLVSNALKYSPSSARVIVRGERRGNEVAIHVQDFGVGIPADEIGFISERFFRARNAEGVPGTGIGLNFVSQIMDLHDGRLDVRSIEGRGSTFSLVLPYRSPEPTVHAVLVASQAR